MRIGRIKLDRKMAELGYEPIREANSDHVLYRHNVTGETMLASRGFFSGGRRGERWYRKMKRKQGENESK